MTCLWADQTILLNIIIKYYIYIYI
jgi:hypothetical protein